MGTVDHNARRWERLEELFEEAVELPRESQPAFVERETASDPELRRQLFDLLEHDTGAGSRIAQAIDSAAGAAAAPIEWTGRRFGPYRILREIGRGGMGLVFEAVRDDDEYRKTVALKVAPGAVLPASALSLDLLRERFRYERQILAGLEHPNIARFLDGGAHDGIPYFAMEYVEGCPITGYAARCALKLRERIALFQEVCGAVQYAHQSLVVHRDLKPGNILVTEEGTPKLLDFGIAKLLSPLDDTGGNTLTGTAPWTPDYASPEQVRSQRITTRTDVYSLGLILFELLAGERGQVADNSSPLAMDRSICEVEVPRPSTRATQVVARQLAGDLDTIVGKATHKDPERRYASVAEFSQDLGRYLEGRPLLARRDSVMYRASKFVRRNWLPVGAAVVAMLGLAGGAVGFAWQARVANRSRIIAEQQRVAAERQRDSAAQEHRNAEQQRDAALREQARAEEMATEAKSQQTRAESMAREAKSQRDRADQRTTQMAGLAQHAVFDLYAAIANLSGTMEARRAMLPKTLEYLERLRRDAADDPEFVRLLGEAYMGVGDIQGSPLRPSLGDLSGALENYRRSVSILTTLAARHPSDARFQISLVGAHNRLGMALRSSGKPAEALQADLKALQTARSAASLAPKDPTALLQVAMTTDELARLLVSNEPDRAEPYAKEALETYQRLVAKEPDNTEYLDSMVSCYTVLSSVTSRRHDLKATYDYLRRGADIRERLVKLKPDDVNVQRNLLISYGRLGDILAASFENLGDPRGAVDYFRKCIELAKQMLARDAKNNTARRDLATSQSRAGQVLSAPEQRAESLDLLSQAVNGFEALLATAPTNGGLRFSAGNTLSLMAVRLRSAGDSVQALDCAKRAIQHLTTPAAAANPLAQDQLAASRAILGLLLAERGDRAGALEEAGKAAEIFRRRAGTVEANFTGNFAVYWSRVGDMYEALARQKDPSPDQRLADWRAAKDAYQRGAAEWRLAPTRQTEVAQLEAKIAECDAQIGRLLSQVPTLRPLPPAKID